MVLGRTWRRKRGVFGRGEVGGDTGKENEGQRRWDGRHVLVTRTVTTRVARDSSSSSSPSSALALSGRVWWRECNGVGERSGGGRGFIAGGGQRARHWVVVLANGRARAGFITVGAW
jgi:hypothetical protein